ncbi:hypothetical protein FRC02_004477 [Tulasnella sp. 418]|nr:hypothetical protein FRC02_004477 [Tulasnella sp. 418]
MQQRKREEEEARNETQRKLDKEKERSQVLKNELEKERKLFKATQTSDERLLQDCDRELGKYQAEILELRQYVEDAKKLHTKEINKLKEKIRELESDNMEKIATCKTAEDAVSDTFVSSTGY